MLTFCFHIPHFTCLFIWLFHHSEYSRQYCILYKSIHKLYTLSILKIRGFCKGHYNDYGSHVRCRTSLYTPYFPFFITRTYHWKRSSILDSTSKSKNALKCCFFHYTTDHELARWVTFVDQMLPKMSLLINMKDKFSNGVSTILVGRLHPKTCFHKFRSKSCKKWPKYQKTFFSSLHNFFKNEDINTWRVSKCPLNPVDASTYRQIYRTTRICLYFRFSWGGQKKAVFLSPSEGFRPFSTTSFWADVIELNTHSLWNAGSDFRPIGYRINQIKLRSIYYR